MRHDNTYILGYRKDWRYLGLENGIIYAKSDLKQFFLARNIK
jgi:hypothetical protein